MALVELPQMGAETAARVLGTLVERLSPACLAMSGVCAGQPDEVALGDVIIADPAYHCLQGKKTPEGFRYDIRTYQPDPLWVRAAKNLRVEDLSRYRVPTVEQSKLWLLRCLDTGRDPLKQVERPRYLRGEAWRSVLRDLEHERMIQVDTFGSLSVTAAGSAIIRRHQQEYPEGPETLPFRVFVGPMASGSYVDISDPWDELRSRGVRKVIGYEMEAVSFGSAARDLRLPHWIVCKGVMDYATSQKTDSVKDFAAHASAEVVWKFLVERFLHQPETVLRPRPVPPVGVGATTAALPVSNLPEMSDDFVGRDGQRRDCLDHLENGPGRLLTIVGPPGAGKTRLATEVAHSVMERYGGRVYLVDLSVVSDPDLVLATITQSLAVEAGDPLIDALRELFRGVPSLIILDNFDRVATAGPGVGQLLKAAPDLRFVVTSQAPLHLRTESVVDVGPLELAEAMQLFNARAGDTMAGAAAQEAVTELCHLLDGLPLAIELVAAHASVLTPQQLQHDHASAEFNTLRNMMQDAESRHQTVDAAIRWSFDLLAPEHQDLFARLAVFDGGWTARAAAQTVGYSPEADQGMSLMTALLDRRLIHVEDTDGAEPRFRMLAPVREFGLRVLRSRGDLADVLADRHAAYFHDLVVSHQAGLNGDEKSDVLAMFARDHANIHTAIDHLVRDVDVRSALRMAVGLDTYWWSRNYAAGSARLTAVLALGLPEDASDHDRELRARACLAAGKLALRRFELADARLRFAETRELARAIGCSELVAYGLEREALVDIEQGWYDEAKSKLADALTLDEELGADEHAADCLDGLGTVACEAGDYGEAMRCFEEAIRRYPSSADHQAEAWVRIDLAQTSLLSGRAHYARDHAPFAWTVGENAGDPGLQMWAEQLLGLTGIALGSASGESREHLTQSLKHALLLGNLRALEGFVALAAAVGRPEDALIVDAAIRSIRDRIGLPRANSEQRLMDGALKAATETLDPSAQARAADFGSLKSLEQVTEFAREI